MSATFPADVFTSTPAPPMTPGCYVSMNREFGSAPALETVHECSGRTDWNCPNGVALELETAEIERELDANWN